MVAELKRESWVTFPKRNYEASLRLFCFPYAGGNAMSFRGWEKTLEKNLFNTVEVCPIELPGRGSRLMEEPFTNFSQLISSLTQALVPYLDKPFAFFGHSMGAIVCFEVAHLLRKKYSSTPTHLFVSGRNAPQVSIEVEHIHNLPERAFLQELRRLNGTPEEVLENTELMQMLLPMLRADFALVENYVYTPEYPLLCSITAFGGQQDPKISQDSLQAWHQQTTGDFSMHMFPGDHFFIHSAQQLILQNISQKLYQVI
ncbi:hypothetical protein DSM106972_091670 [Dulcicalothrix desertica PCC 7102]|uniref:Thioesterase domain-containing protein n=1 Tax=Dulcicalothrix desertica PCC 7102 TaxID=232991 RepID=A0A3S1BUA3_9CYAN|nr:thioesterase II family protein [Dulcicalothrix desertica]RUS95007.1 hypothetical protein DSM106972_091670 [Dulcicalothrix desertica PCC 7102]TWH51417.1 medium-chain acyl-[acyl-carrier-protein] hydrolase [Dulcicalothrix desertica PCC 7102]